MSSPTIAAPFTQAVVRAMRKLYPEALADKSFDNTGLLLESPFNPRQRNKNSVLLTIDLTKAVADEAIARKDSVIVAYHPIIFRGLKSLTLKDTQQQSLLRLAAEGISVYSPHTAVDCAQGGLGDWLADIVTGTPTNADTLGQSESEETHESPSAKGRPDASPGNGPQRPTYMLQHHPSQLGPKPAALKLGGDDHRRYPIQATKVPGHADAGMGRIVRFATAVPLTEIVSRIGLGLGSPKGFPVAVPQGRRVDEVMIRSVALCAGSGGHLFADAAAAGEDVDLLFTGELSHHEALAAIEQGKCVICLFHSNTERGFLHGVLKEQLDRTVKEEWAELRREGQESKETGHELREAFDDDHVEVHVSEVDRDPYGIMINESAN